MSSVRRAINLTVSLSLSLESSTLGGPIGICPAAHTPRFEDWLPTPAQRGCACGRWNLAGLGEKRTEEGARYGGRIVLQVCGRALFGGQISQGGLDCILCDNKCMFVCFLFVVNYPTGLSPPAEYDCRQYTTTVLYWTDRSVTSNLSTSSMLCLFYCMIENGSLWYHHCCYVQYDIVFLLKSNFFLFNNSWKQDMIWYHCFVMNEFIEEMIFIVGITKSPLKRSSVYEKLRFAVMHAMYSTASS